MNNIWKEMFSSQNNKKAQEQGGLFAVSLSSCFDIKSLLLPFILDIYVLGGKMS